MTNPRVLSFSANATTGKIARFTVGTDIIDYIESSRAFGREDLSDPNTHGRFQRRMIAIPDKNKKSGVVTPMVLTISNQNQLYLVRKDKNSKSGDGWKLIDLSQTFKSTMGSSSIRVRAHAAAWTNDDRITIAVAVDDGSSERSRVFVAYDLSSDTSDWDNIPWTDCGSREDVRIEGIRVLDGGDRTWTVVLAGDRGPNDTLYLLRNNFQKSFAQALIFNPAVALEKILDFEVAVHPTLGAGIAVLGINGRTRDLSFRPFPAYKADGSFSTIPPVEPLPCPAGAKVLETGLTKQIQAGRRRTYVGSDIYVGGQGVHLIQASDVLEVVVKGGEISLTPVVSSDAAPNVQDLIVGEAPDGSISVWSLLQNGDLNTIKKVSANACWGEPLRLRVGVQAIAPVHGDEHLTTSLLIVYTNGQASFLARDASQGIWQERPLTVANPEEVTKVTCYGTTLRVLNEGSLPQPGIKVNVSASVLSSVVLNGRAVFIGPNLSVPAETDFNGSISLFDRVRSLTPAIYRFEIEGLSECIDVNPASGVHERFQSITADELRSATISTPNGEEALLPENFRTGTDKQQVDILVSSLNQVSSLANSSSGIVPGVTLVSQNQPFSSTLRTEVVSDNYSCGIQVDSNGIKPISDSKLDQIIHAAENPRKFFKNLGDGICDFFEGLWQSSKVGGLTNGLIFIVSKTIEAGKDVFEFICGIGDEIIRHPLESLEKVGRLFEVLWNQVKIGLEKVWEYCKFLFDWEDILRVKRAMVDVADETLHYLQDSVGTMKASVEEGFDSVIKQIDQWRTEAVGGPPTKLDKPAPGSSFLDAHKEATKDKQKEIDQASGNSVVAWVMNKINELGNEIIEFEGPDPLSHLSDAVTEFFTGVVADEIEALSGTFEQIKADVVRLFDGKFPTLDDLSLEVIKKLLIAVGADVIEGLLKGIKSLVLRFLDLTQELIGVIRDVLFTKVRFPFIEKLIKLVSSGTLSVDTSFTLVDGLMLLCAVPATISYKLLRGESPLKKGQVFTFPFLDNRTVMVQSGTFAVEQAAPIIQLVKEWGQLFYTTYLMTNLVNKGDAISKNKGAAYLSIGLVVFGCVAEIATLPDKCMDTVCICKKISALMLVLRGSISLGVLGSHIGGGGEMIRSAKRYIGGTAAFTSFFRLGLNISAYVLMDNKELTKFIMFLCGEISTFSLGLGAVILPPAALKEQTICVICGSSFRSFALTAAHASVS